MALPELEKNGVNTALLESGVSSRLVLRGATRALFELERNAFLGSWRVFEGNKDVSEAVSEDVMLWTEFVFEFSANSEIGT